jgi:MFS family permease
MSSRPYTLAVYRLSAGFFALFMSFNTVQYLFSTVLKDKMVAFVSLAAIYAAFTPVAIPAPKIVSIIGPRLAIFFGALPYAALTFGCMLVQQFPNANLGWPLLLPLSAAVGVGAAVLWTGQGIYVSRCAVRESNATGESVDAVTGRMNGIFWSTFQFNGGLGLIIGGLLKTVRRRGCRGRGKRESDAS